MKQLLKLEKRLYFICFFEICFTENQPTAAEPETPVITSDAETRISTVEETQRKLRNRKAAGIEGL